MKKNNSTNRDGHSTPKMKALPFLLLIVLQTVCLFAFSQTKHLQFNHLGTNEGLSHSRVFCILRDSRGFMWFGTREGLNKYDGYKFTVYTNDSKNPNSLSNNVINDIKESKNGDLWIATLGGGLCRYNRKKDQFTTFKNDPNNSNSISSDFVTSILEDSQGNLWIGTQNGLNMFDTAKNKFVIYTYNSNDKNSLSDISVRNIFEDANHNLWVGTLNGGLNLFNRKNKTFTSFQHSITNNKSISSNDVYTMFEDSKHRFWIGTEGGGLNLFNKESGEFYQYKKDDKTGFNGNSVHAINEDNENNLWISIENAGVTIFNPDKGVYTTYLHDEIDQKSISDNSIYSIYKDTNGNMWLGTFNGGVNLVNPNTARFAHYKHMLLKNSLSNNNVLCIYEDSKKNIWLGTDGSGLNLFDPQTDKFTFFHHEKNNSNSICGNYVLSVYEDSKGNIWIGTWADGITVFNPTKNTFKHFKHDPANARSLSNNNAWKIFEDKEKNIWVGTSGGGLNLFDPATNSFISYQYKENDATSISSNYIFSIYEDSESKLWVTTDGGLNMFNKKTKTFSRFLHDNKNNSISNDNLGSICEDRNKNIWIGTMSGLNCLDKKNGRFTNFTTADGLPNDVIFGILEDDKGNLWISTNKGISRFNLATRVFKNFDESDGLQSSEFKVQAFCKSTSGMMYFGGTNGFNQFFPDSIKPIPFEPPMVITSFQVFNKEVPIAISEQDASPLKESITETKAITLPYKSAVFSFEFASLNYTGSAKKQYVYMLEGFDKSWHEAGTQRTATYTNLNPGKYVFKVKGLNNEGGWSTNMASIQITITPPFWLTWWFRLLLFLTIAGSIVAFNRVRINSIQRKKEVLQSKVEQQTAQLILANKEEQKARLESEQARAESDKARQEADEANHQLKIKNKELEQFVYVASHDLQEPLRTTSSFVGLIQKKYYGKLDPNADIYLTYILEASNRMKVLIKDLLDFSLIGTKKELKLVDCNKILKEVLADLGIAIKESGAQVEFSDLPVITGFPTEIKLLFQNLLINAIKFRKKEVAPKIKIEVQKTTNHWEFVFRDNGIGIDENYREKIFDIFQRLHTRTEYEGSGIGLSHCKKIVELHQGQIWVTSTLGEGSNFYFTIQQKSIL